MQPLDDIGIEVGTSRKVIPEELVTLMSWYHRDFLSCLVMVRLKGKDLVKEGALDLSCLLNRVPHK